MGIKEYIKRKRQLKKLPLIARLSPEEFKHYCKENHIDDDKSILESADYTKSMPKIRLSYIALGLFQEFTKIGQTNGISSPFFLPAEMTFEEACKVISYLSEKIEQENSLQPASEESVIMVSNILEEYGFKKLSGYNHGHIHTIGEYFPFKKISTISPKSNPEENITNLYTVGGDFKLFKKSDLYSEYFDWFTPGITENEVRDIYKRIRKEYLLKEEKNDSRTITSRVKFPNGEEWVYTEFLDKGKIVIDDEEQSKN